MDASGPLPAPASRREEAKTRSKNCSQKTGCFRDTNKTTRPRLARRSLFGRRNCGLTIDIRRSHHRAE